MKRITDRMIVEAVLRHPGYNPRHSAASLIEHAYLELRESVGNPVKLYSGQRAQRFGAQGPVPNTRLERIQDLLDGVS